MNTVDTAIIVPVPNRVEQQWNRLAVIAFTITLLAVGGILLEAVLALNNILWWPRYLNPVFFILGVGGVISGVLSLLIKRYRGQTGVLLATFAIVFGVLATGYLFMEGAFYALLIWLLTLGGF